VGSIEGISSVRWTNPPAGEQAPSESPAGLRVPLLAESLTLLLLAYLIGFALAWLLFGRKRREGFY